jgi:uncharacterized membrane protein
MRDRWRGRTVGAMERLFQVVLAVHIAAGAVSLLVFSVPLVTKKGGRTHRRFGWVYVAAAAAVAVTGFLSCIPLVSSGSPLRWRAGIFLAYVSLLAGASAQFGVRALRTKRRTGASRGALDLVPPLLLVAGGVALAAFGIHRSMVLYVLFAALGVVLGVAQLRFWLTPPAHERAWLLAHMTGMGTSCITTVTAFIVVNARRFGMRTFDLPLWAGPIAVLAVGLTLWRRYYARRLTGNDAPAAAPKVQ